MKKILLIGYDFPPGGGVASQRITKFFKYLPEFDIDAYVLTTAHGMNRFVDSSLLEQNFINEDKIFRLGGKRLLKYHQLKHLERIEKCPYYYYLGIKYLPFMDFFSSWYFETIDQCLELCIKHGFDCIFTTSPAHSTHFFGSKIKKECGIPWILDLRDSMVNHACRADNLSQKAINLVERWYEKRFFKEANAITTVSLPILTNMESRIRKPVLGKSYVITNGFDSDDYNVKSENIGPRNEDKLLITYTGSFPGKITPEFFVRGYNHFSQNTRINPSKIKLKFVGYFPDSIKNILELIPKETEIEFTGPVTHSESIQHQIQADILLLILPPAERKYGSEIMTGKVFEYMASGKTIFALVPDGPLKNLLDESKTGISVPPDDVNAISKAIGTLYKKWHDNQLFYSADATIVNKYERRHLTSQLADIIKTLC